MKNDHVGIKLMSQNKCIVIDFCLKHGHTVILCTLKMTKINKNVICVLFLIK